MKTPLADKSNSRRYTPQKLVVILPCLVVILWVAAAVELLCRHGGFKGNVRHVSYGPSHSLVIDNSENLPILFNRWMIDPRDLSPPERTLGYVCLPAFRIASWITSGLNKSVPEFQKFAPYGLTFPTYEVALAILFSLIMWGFVGYVLDVSFLRR